MSSPQAPEPDPPTPFNAAGVTDIDPPQDVPQDAGSAVGPLVETDSEEMNT